MSLYWQGLIIGFSIAAPVGPIGVLCIRRTLNDGRMTGLVSGLGAATADALYGLVAGLGLTAVSGFLVDQQVWLRVVGGLFLCFLGVRTLLSRPAEAAPISQAAGLTGAYLSTLFLTLTNPLTILSFVAIFAGLGMVDAGGLSVVAGVFCGSALWWLALSEGVSLFRGWFTPGRMIWVNRLAGLVIIAFGLLALLRPR